MACPFFYPDVFTLFPSNFIFIIITFVQSRFNPSHFFLLFFFGVVIVYIAMNNLLSLSLVFSFV